MDTTKSEMEIDVLNTNDQFILQELGQPNPDAPIARVIQKRNKLIAKLRENLEALKELYPDKKIVIHIRELRLVNKDRGQWPK